MRSLKPYVKTYSLLPHATRVRNRARSIGSSSKRENKRVVISLSAPAHRLPHLLPTIASILDQTVRVDQISLNVPPEDWDKIPEETKREYKSAVNVFKTGKNYGVEDNRVIPTVLREREADTRIICLDDAFIYGKDLIEILVDESEKTPDIAVETRGAIIFTPDQLELGESYENESERRESEREEYHAHSEELHIRKRFLDRLAERRKVDYEENLRRLSLW